MSQQWSSQKFSETIAEIRKRSVSDTEFRALALKDASAAVEAVIGEPLPPGAKLRFVNQIDEIVIQLPPAEGGELTEEQLEQVAGGTLFIGAAVAVAASTVIGVGGTITYYADCN